MTLNLTPIAHGTLCHGARWSIVNEDQLAEQVARVAMGQYRHVARILEGMEGGAPRTSKDHAEDAKRKMEVSVNGDPWHRDGWIFQVISWLGALQVQSAQSATASPHIFKAHKGFDGLQLELGSEHNSIVAIVIFEDKATTDPRTTIREDVWPAIESFEQGKRVGELTSELTSLLEGQQSKYPDLDVDAVIDTVIWKDARRYRVCITTGSTHASDANRKGLFGGYDTKAGGDLVRRRAESMHFDDLRDWMEKFAAKVTAKIDEIANV